MPSALTVRTAPTTERSEISVRDLRVGERFVALYASDMPTHYRFARGDEARITAWIEQGVARLGVEALRLRTAYYYGHRLLDMENLVTPEIRERHRRAFSERRRARRAESLAALSLYHVEMSDEARTRVQHVDVDGQCPCQGTGSIPLGRGAEATWAKLCPVHRHADIRSMQAPAGVSA